MHDFFAVARSSRSSVLLRSVAVEDEAKTAKITERPNSLVMARFELKVGIETRRIKCKAKGLRYIVDKERTLETQTAFR